MDACIVGAGQQTAHHRLAEAPGSADQQRFGQSNGRYGSQGAREGRVEVGGAHRGRGRRGEGGQGMGNEPTSVRARRVWPGVRAAPV
ncbi:MAG: hypothetical protein ACK559_15050, partial [bacterium]